MFIAIAALAVFSSGASAQDNSTGLTVHEWGTFTTLTTSYGKRLEGLSTEEEQLPGFVHNHGFVRDPFSVGPVNKENDVFVCKSATTKMETPVIYFYTPQEVPVSVKVRFPWGSITQWYPQRTVGEVFPRLSSTNYDITKGALNLGIYREGWIQWDATVLAPTDPHGLTPSPKEENHTWTAPRAVDANTIVCKNEAEKFLFYRGIGNLTFPLTTRFSSDGSLTVNNASKDEIPFVFIYSKTDAGVSVWWTGMLVANSKQTIIPKAELLTEAELETHFANFRKALVYAGLYEKEAAAMLDTWKKSYFGTNGLKVFWIVPPQLTEQILPMEITPKPANIARVLVGRSEILTQEFENQICKDFTAGKESKWIHDRFYYAYSQLAAQLGPLSVEDDDPVLRLSIQPNPVTNAVTIECPQIPGNRLRLDITDAEGKLVYTNQLTPDGGTLRQTIDVSSLTTGAYYVRIFGDNSMRRGMFVK